MTRPTTLDLTPLLVSVVTPVLVQLLKPGELQSMVFAWETEGGLPTSTGLWLTLDMKGETARLPLWTPGEPELTDVERRSRLASDLQDFIAESRFAWGQLRTHDF